MRTAVAAAAALTLLVLALATVVLSGCATADAERAAACRLESRRIARRQAQRDVRLARLVAGLPVEPVPSSDPEPRTW